MKVPRYIKNASVLVAIPSKDCLLTETVVSLYKMFNSCLNDGLHMDLFLPKSSMLVKNRNNALKTFLAGDWTHLMWIDSDMTFPADIIQQLLAHKKEAVAGIARVRGNQSWNIFTKFEEKQTGVFGIKPFSDTVAKTGLHKIDFTGLSCMLCKRSAVEDYEGFEETSKISEDFHYCAYLLNTCKELFADTNIVCGHVVLTELGAEYR